MTLKEMHRIREIKAWLQTIQLLRKIATNCKLGRMPQGK